MAETKLYWVRQHSFLYRPISMGVLQEICAYCVEVPTLCLILKGSMFTFDFERMRWKPICAIPLDVDYLWSYTSLRPGQVFLWGSALEKTTATGRVISQSTKPYLVENGALIALRHTSGLRARPGLIYLNSKVYVFGGCYDGIIHTDKPLFTAECFSMVKMDWNKLPFMLKGRAAFNPCHFLSLIFLCGGLCRTVETFNYSTNQYRELPNFPLSRDFQMYGTSTVAFRGKIAVLGFDSLYEWKRETGVRLVARHEGCASRSIATPVAYRGFMYVVDAKGVCRVVSLADGRVMTDVSVG